MPRGVRTGEDGTRDADVTLKDHIQDEVVLDVRDPVCLYTFIYVEIKTWTIDFEESQDYSG